MNNWVITSVFLLLISTSGSAAIYKWVDDAGKTHYSQLAPVRGETQVERFVAADAQGGPNTVITRLPAAERRVSAKAREIAIHMAQDQLKLAYDHQPLNCAQAVSNITTGLDNVQQTAQKQFKDGGLNDIELEQVQNLVRVLKERIDLAHCHEAVTVNRQFYRCMSSPYSHVLACMNKHQVS